MWVCSDVPRKARNNSRRQSRFASSRAGWDVLAFAFVAATYDRGGLLNELSF